MWSSCIINPVCCEDLLPLWGCEFCTLRYQYWWGQWLQLHKGEEISTANLSSIQINRWKTVSSAGRTHWLPCCLLRQRIHSIREISDKDALKASPFFHLKEAVIRPYTKQESSPIQMSSSQCFLNISAKITPAPVIDETDLCFVKLHISISFFSWKKCPQGFKLSSI